MSDYNTFNAIAVRDYYPTHENPGNSIWVFEQVIGLQKRGIKSLVISPTPYIPNFLRNYKYLYLYPKSCKKIELYKGTSVIRPPFLKLPSRFFANYNISIQKKLILKYAKGINPELIHAHFGRNGLAAVPLKKKLNIPLVTYFYGDDVGINEHAAKLSKFYKPLIEHGNLFLALSQDMKNDLINIGFPANKILVHHLGIDIANFNKSSITSTKKSKEKVIICSVGRFTFNKGGQDVIEAFSKLIYEDINAELRIVGDGPHINELKNLCYRNTIQESVVFINNFKDIDPRGRVINEMKNSDIFILTPFMYKNGIKTGTPVVLMEAQALGVPCVSTNYAGIPEVLNFGESGILVEPRNIDQIHLALKSLCLDINKRTSLGRKGRRYVEKEFNQNIQLDKLTNYYKSLSVQIPQNEKY